MTTAQSSTSLRGLRVAVVQPVLPRYRVPFFDLLARRTGIELTVLCDMHPSGSLRSDRPTDAFRAEHWPLKSRGPFIDHPAILEAARSRRFDLAVLGWNMRMLQLVPALLTGASARRPVLLWGHGFSKSERSLKRSARDALVRLSSGVIVYGSQTQRRLLESGLPPGKVHLAQNAIDQSEIRAATAEWIKGAGMLEDWQRRQGIVPGELIVFISRMEPDKRADLLVEAFARLAPCRPGLKLALIGGGSCLPAITSKVNELGIADRVRLTGPLYEERLIAPWCLSAGCFAYPEAIGLSVYHAFGYGLPVVTSDDLASHNPEVESIVPGRNGMLYRHRDIVSFADALNDVLSNPARREEWRNAALATVNRAGGFSLETMVSGYAEALAATASRSPRADLL